MTTPSPRAENEAAPKATWLDAYELGEQLETNALTVTYLAERQTDRFKVLVKTVRPGLRKSDRALALLARERDVINTTRHRALPRLLEVVQSPERIALIYARSAGHRLADVLDRAPRVASLPALAIAIELSSVLAALHRAGHVHGRLRAESIELTEDGAVVLHDPAGAGARGGGGDPDLDAPENMAPEQVLGQTPSPETDVYLLGKLVYQMVSGAMPFTPGAGGITQQIRHAEPPPLSANAPDAPRELQRIVSRCLQKRGRDRYADMASLQSELTRILRSDTSLGSEHLVAMALADAGLGAELAVPRERDVTRGATSAPPWLAPALRYGGAALGFVLLVSFGWWLLDDDDSAYGNAPMGIHKRPAQLRVLAQPWAEIHVDGELVDITPVGRAIELEPGKHVVVFKHPNSESVTREVEIIAGQTILLDVDMPVVEPPDAGAADAGDAGAPDAGPPPPAP